MNLLLDTAILGKLVHPKRRQNQLVSRWMERLLEQFANNVQVFLPEIADYELRRKLLHLLARKQTSFSSIHRLDELAALLDYLPLSTSVMHRAAQLWADSRMAGSPTSADVALDGDAILAAQALEVGGTIVTTNRKHLQQFVPCQDWTEIESEMANW
ncbi:MAG: PIN domain-containing protein [Planctomycetaceae bacterium]|nr:PIN domain-containing protein [Planctomycetaceae bacterium]